MTNLRPRSPALAYRLGKMYSSGMGLKKIAAATGVPKTSLYRILLAAGVKMRRTGRPKGSGGRPARGTPWIIPG